MLFKNLNKNKIMNNHYKDIIQNYGYGAISGMGGILISHPIDTIKTNYQEGLKLNFNLRSLYRGLKAPLIGISLEKAIVFGTYALAYNNLGNHGLSGALAGFTASFIVTPYERIKILLQTGKEVKLNNITGLFQGLSATFYREVPGFAIYFSLFNYLKDKVVKERGEINMIEAFSYGGLSGAVSWVFIYPQDRIKTHIQSFNNKITFRESVRYILSESGGLYRGFHLALLRAIPLHATTFMINEFCKTIF